MTNTGNIGTTLMRIPVEAFTDQLRVRSYEVGRNGMIGLSTALRYCEALATDASAAIGFDRSWYVEHHTAWVVREMTILLGALPRIGEELRLATWVSEFRRVQAQREYAIWQNATGRMVARASARWAYCDALRGQLTRIPNELLQTMRAAGSAMPAHYPRSRVIAPESESPIANTFSTYFLQAREYETDTQQHINNCVYADWLDETLHQATNATAPVPGADILRPRFYHIEYVRAVIAGDLLRVDTQLAFRGTHGISSEHSIMHLESNTAAVRAYAEHIRQARPYLQV